MSELKDTKISKDMFEFVQVDKSIHDEKFNTKPIGYFKDAFIRFTKNKSSVVAAIIIIILLLFAIIAPWISRYNYHDTSSPKYTMTDGHYSYARPKSNLFQWMGWDGATDEIKNQSGYDLYKGMSYEVYQTKNVVYDPIVKDYGSMEVDGETKYNLYVDSYYRVGYQFVILSAEEYFRLQAYQNQANIQIIYPMPAYHNGTQNANIWYELPEEATEILAGANASLNVDKTVSLETAAKYVDGKFVPAYLGSTNKNINNYYSLRLSTDNGEYTYKTVQVKNSKVVKKDGKLVYTETPNTWYRYAVRNQTGYKVRVLYYEYYRYLKTNYTYNNYNITPTDIQAKHTTFTEEDVNSVLNGFKFDLDSGFYPMFYFGSTSNGSDLFTLLGSGARLSFLLAICISAINLIIGAIYGAIEGYYGGRTDLIMERVSDVLSGIPFIVVATLFKLHVAEHVGALVSLIFAFVMTGWIGMAARVRMQFYRFKGQEYILSARTLGASDKRIMFKHIFPNAIGTIITGSVLAIPGVIFSESSLSYLGIIDLETSGYTSIGTLLSNASSSQFTKYPYIMFFPALFIALLMISFNLFGNGLRDAFNPSLRGADE